VWRLTLWVIGTHYEVSAWWV